MADTRHPIRLVIEETGPQRATPPEPLIRFLSVH